MSVLKTLRESVAPELNHLYTMPPVEIPGGGGVDYGWHGREHALHACLVARLFGAEAELCTGDFAVLSRFVPALSTLGKDEQHAWCSVNGVAPVDLSMTFRHLGQVPQLRSAIVGDGRNGDWQVTYAEDESVLDDSIENGNEILFIEKQVRADPVAGLVSDPFGFLPPAKPEDTTSPHALHGPSIYAKITLHAYRCATGETRNLRHRLDRTAALAWIAENYPDAETQLLAKLR